MTIDVAIAHDYLTQRGGAERVVAAICRAFPDAPVHTSVYEPSGTHDDFARVDVRTTALQRVGPLRRNPRLALPFLAPAVSRHRIDAEVTICSTSGWAHGFPTTGAKVVYAHNTPRWLYQRAEYLADLPRIYGYGLAPLVAPLRRWDRRAGTSADLVLANSQVVRERVRRFWGRDAEVLYPPPGLSPEGARQALPGIEPGYLLAVSRLLPYKRLDVVIDAVSEHPGQRLVIVGDGPDRARLAARASDRTRFVPTVTDDELRWLYANAAALVTAAQEDFGLTPLEAMGFGIPTVAIAAGGFLETIDPDVTGLHFDAPTADSLRATLARLSQVEWDRDALLARAAQFSEAAFIDRLQQVVAETAAGSRA